MKLILSRISIVLLFLFFSNTIFGQYPPNTIFTTIVPPTNAVAPGYLSTYDDNTTATRMKQITQEGRSTHSYPKRQTWNIDETKYKIRTINVYDAETHEVYKSLSGLDLYESVWSNTNPDIIYGFTVEGKIRRYNIDTEVLDLLYDLNGSLELYDEVKLGPGEGNIDIHDKYVALIAHVKNTSDIAIIIFDLQTEQLVTTKTFEGMWRDDDWQHQYIDWVSVSQSGNYLGIMWNHNYTSDSNPYVDNNGASHYGVEMYNTTDLNYLRRLVRYGNHGDFGFAPDGSEVFVQFYGWVQGENGSVFSYHLDGSAVDIILTNKTFETNGSHISCRNILRPGWAYLNTVNYDGGHGRMLAVKLDGSKIIENFGHSFEKSGDDFYAYAAPVPNPTGTKIMFMSNFGDNSSSSKICIYEAYSIDKVLGVVGQWDFEDPNDLGKATVGANLQLLGSPTPTAGANNIDNKSVKVENGNHLKAVTNFAPIFPNTKINTYTLSIDFKMDVVNAWSSLLQTELTNTQDGRLFVGENGQIGKGSIGYSANNIISASQWYRMVMVVEKHNATDDVSVDIYIDGSKVLEGTRQSVDSYYALGDSVYFFLDDGNEELPTDVAQIVLYNYALTSAEVAELGNVPTPVELTSFIATVSNDGVVLNWETATEVNNYGFEVESKRASTDEWSKIGFIAGHGNSNSPNSYSFVVPVSADEPSRSYRLKQIDIDGTSEYSDIVEVNLGLPSDFELSQNYPNPFNPTTVIRFAIPEVSKVSITVFNALGQEVAELANREFSVGNHKVSFNASNLASGMYVYRISATSATGNFVAVRKMLLLK